MSWPEAFRAKFWARVDSSGGPDACWPWLGGKSYRRHGSVYGIARTPDGRKVGAHRVALALSGDGELKPLEAMHACDFPLCCNPGHLSWGTHRQNVHDYQRKYRPGGNKAHLGMRLRIR